MRRRPEVASELSKNWADMTVSPSVATEPDDTPPGAASSPFSAAPFRPEADPPSFRSSLLVVLLADLVLVAIIQALVPRHRSPLTGLTVVGALSVPFALLVVMRPILRRLAWRDLTSSLRTSLAYVATAMVGTAAITSAFGVGNVLDAATRRPVVTHLGPVDEIVDITASTDRSEAIRRIQSAATNHVDGVLAADVQPVAVSLISGSRVRTVGARLIATDLVAAGAFGGDANATGLSGATPTEAGHALVSSELAAALGLRPGVQLHIDPIGANLALIVDRVLPARGLASLLSDATATESGANVFVSGALPAVGNQDRIRHLVLVSNKGGVEGGAKLSAAVVTAIENALAPSVSLENGSTSALSTTDASVIAVKADALANAQSASRRYRSIFTGTSLASILIGTLLLIATALSLAEERRHERGVLRAMGLRRAATLAMSAIEGWILALVAAVVGAGLGAVATTGIVAVARRVYGRSDSGLDLRGAIGMAGLGGGLAVGFVAALGASLGAALWETRRDALGALRNLPPAVSHGSRLGRGVGGLVAVVGTGLFATQIKGTRPTLLLVGLVVAIVGAGVIALRPDRSRATLSGLAVATAVGAVAVAKVFKGPFAHADLQTYVTLGIIVSAASVALVLANFDQLSRVTESIGARFPGRGTAGSRALAARLAVSEPRSRPARTAVITATFALTTFTATLLSLLGHVIDTQSTARTARIRGSFVSQVDIVAGSTTLPAWAAQPGIAALGDTAVELAIAGSSQFKPAQMTRFDATYATTPSVVDAALPGIKTNAEAFNRVLGEYGSAIVALPDGLQDRSPYGPGRSVVVSDPASGRTLNIKIVGVTTSAGSSPAVWVSPATAANLVGVIATDRLLLPALAPNSDTEKAILTPDATVAAIRSIGQVVAAQQRSDLALLHLLQAHLSVGFLTALVGLASLLLRAAQERRRSIAVLRSMGAPGAALRRAFILESLSLAIVGSVIGIVAALVSVWRLLASGTFGRLAPLPVPISSLVVILGVALLASVLAAIAPARRATSSSPASALRV